MTETPKDFIEILYKEKDNLSPEILKAIGEIYIQYKAEKSGVDIKNNEQDEMMKYYTMGWFVYNNLINKK